MLRGSARISYSWDGGNGTQMTRIGRINADLMRTVGGMVWACPSQSLGSGSPLYSSLVSRCGVPLLSLTQGTALISCVKTTSKLPVSFGAMRLALVKALSFSAMTCCLGQDRIWVCTNANELIALDQATCQTTLIGISSTVFSDIAFTPNGRLWGCRDTYLYEIDPQNASDVVVGSMPGFGTAALVAFNNDTLLGEYQAWLWGIRVSDGFAWRIDSIGYYATGDLTWYEGALFMTAYGNPRKLIRMEVSDDLTSVNNVEVVGPFVGGMGQWYGAITVMTDTCEHSLIMLGFDVFDVYQISQSDASITMFCPGAIPTGTTGATSFGEMREVQRAEKIFAPNVFSPNGDGLNDLFQPTSNTSSFQWSIEVYNRWGQKVHDSKGLTIPWDGRTEAGQSCPEGSYYYILTYTSNCDSGRSQGHVTLLRN